MARLEEDLLAAEQRRSNPGETSADAFDGLGSAGPSGLLDDGAPPDQSDAIKIQMYLRCASANQLLCSQDLSRNAPAVRLT